MDILISHTTALRLLRDPELDVAGRGRNARAVYAPACAVDAFTVRNLANTNSVLWRAGEPLEFVTSDAHGARRRPSYVSRVFGARLPEGSVFQMRGGVWCSGPELTASQLANHLTELQLVVVLCELMGAYALGPDLEGGLVQRRRPLTDPNRLEAFLDEFGGVKGPGHCGARRRWHCPARPPLARPSSRSGSACLRRGRASG